MSFFLFFFFSTSSRRFCEKNRETFQNSPVDRVCQLLKSPVRQVDVVHVRRAPHLRLRVVDLPLHRRAVVHNLDDDARLVPAADPLVAVLLRGVAREGAAAGVVDCLLLLLLLLEVLEGDWRWCWREGEKTNSSFLWKEERKKERRKKR